VRLAFQALAALFMFATAMNLLNVHPIFRFMSFQPPKFAQKWIHSTTKSKAIFAPALLGFLTIFVPCGVTQSMEVLAINLGNPVQGALIMFAFVLGTTPLFVALGLAMVKFSEGWRVQFLRLAAVVLIGMSLYSVNGVLTVLDAPIAWNNLVSASSRGAVPATQTDQMQQVTINVLNSGYAPRSVVVQVGKPVELTLVTNETYSCAVAFTFKEFGISTFLEPTGRKTFTFTPTQKGTFTYTCSMGMYTGTMQVI
jgi:plastocyanin